MDQQLLNLLTNLGFQDFQCNKVIIGDIMPEESKPGEKEFLNLLLELLSKEEDVEVHDYNDWDFPMAPLPKADQYKMAAAFVGMNVIKILRSVGLNVGPEFIDYLQFPVWRPAVWRESKVGKCWSFIGIPQPEIASAVHPFDYARSTRFNTSVMIRETPDPETMAGEDYLKHHKHGLVGLAAQMGLSFIDINTQERTFRFYCIQGCSRLYHWDELKNDRKVLECIKAKVVIKGRIPRTQDFVFTHREGWDPKIRPIVKYAQGRVLELMKNISPLFPIQMTLAQLANYCIMDIAPIVVDQFLDGRTGMSYGFLAYQLPVEDVSTCTEVKVLCTRSGCDKQNPHEENDWVVLSANTENVFLEMSAGMKGTTSPSFDSWLILAQAAANVAVAKRLKDGGRSPEYVEMVEKKGVALCHFHGYINRAVLPSNMAFWGHTELPLPCGSVESAFLTVREKRSIAEKVMATHKDISFIGDVHVEPDHGSVVSCSFDTLEKITMPGNASYGLGNFTTFSGTWDPTV